MPRKKSTKRKDSTKTSKRSSSRSKSLPVMEHKKMSASHAKMMSKAPLHKSMMKRRVPTGVKILSILWYVGSVLLLLLALLLFVAGAFIVPLLIDAYPLWASLGAGIAAIVGIFSLIFAVLYFFIAKGLMKGKNWARILVVVLSLLGIIGAFGEFSVGFAGALFKLLVNGVIVWYLMFNETSKRFFE